MIVVVNVFPPAKGVNIQMEMPEEINALKTGDQVVRLLQ